MSNEGIRGRISWDEQSALLIQAPREGIHPMPGKQDFLNDPLGFLKACYEISRNNYKNGYPEAVMYDIEQVLLQFTDDELSHYGADLTPTQAKEALQYVHGLTRLYGGICAQINPFPSTIQAVTSSTLFVMASGVMRSYYAQDPTFNVLIDYFTIQEMGSLMRESRSEDGRRLPSVDPRFDARSQYMHQLFSLKKQETLEFKSTYEQYYSIGASESDVSDCYDIAFIKSRCPHENLKDMREKLYRQSDDLDLQIREDYDTFLQFCDLSAESRDMLKGRFNPEAQDILSIGNPKSRQQRLKIEPSKFSVPYKICFPDPQGEAFFIDKTYRYQAKPKIPLNTLNDALHVDTRSPVYSGLFTSGAVSSNLRVLNRKNGESRSLAFTSHRPELSVVVSRDFFESQLELLQDPDYQKLVWMNFFVSGGLQEVLRDTPFFAEEMNRFLERALRYHIQGDSLTGAGVFIFQLYDGLMRYGVKNERIEKQLLEQLEIQQKNGQVKITNRLLQIRFLMRSHDDTPVSVEELPWLFQALLSINASDYILDTALFRAKQKMRPQLVAAFEQLTPQMQTELIKNSLPPEYQSLEIHEIQFPIVNLENGVQMNLVLGKITTPQGIYGYIPPEVSQNAQFKQLFGEAVSTATIRSNQDVLLLQFIYENKSYRIIFKAGQPLRIQTQGLESASWFEWVTENSSLPVINERYRDPDCLWWRAVEKRKQYTYPDDFCSVIHRDASGRVHRQDVLYIKRMEVGFHYFPEQICFELEAETGQQNGYAYVWDRVSENQAFYAFFERFETKSYISIFKHESGNIKVQLPRYGLEWLGNYDVNTQTWCFVLASDPDFTLEFNAVDIIDKFSHGLSMRNSKTGERMLLVPRQEFYVADPKEHDGEYYALTYDTSNKITNSLFKEQRWDRTSLINMNSQKFDTFKVTGDRLQADTAESYLQLAYLYLAKHDPVNAMHYLRSANDLGLLGTDTEVQMIMKIMIGIPNRDIKPNYYDDAYTNEPETIAVRLYAAHMLAMQQQQSLHKMTSKIATSALEIFQAEKIAKFYEHDFLGVIETLYRDYRKIQGNIPEYLQLSYEQRLCLLKLQTQLTPAMQHERASLELIVLKEERALLRKRDQPCDIQDAQIEYLRKTLQEYPVDDLEDRQDLYCEELLHRLETEQEIVDLVPCLYPGMPNEPIIFSEIEEFDAFRTSILALKTMEISPEEFQAYRVAPFEARQMMKNRLEQERGRAHNDMTQEKNRRYLEYLTPEKILLIKQSIETLTKKMAFDPEAAKAALVRQANHWITGSLDDSTGIKACLGFEDLLLLYLQGDLRLFLDKT
jgi:hypothetical protein